MSKWRDNQMTERVLEVLDDVHPREPGHHFGQPFISAYQLAVEMDARWPHLPAALGQHLGGRGTEDPGHESLPRYVANQLSRRILNDPGYPVEGAFLSNHRVDLIRFRRADGDAIESSLTGSRQDMSMFRRRMPQ